MSVLMTLLACGGGRPAVVATPALPDTAHMQEVLDAAHAARMAIIAGDQRAARGRLAWLADNAITSAPPPPDLGPFVDQVRGAAAKGANGGNLLTLGLATAEMAAACGGCHQAANTGPIFVHENLPPGSDIESHMARHQWAVDSMWEGLIAPDNHRWRSGAFAFLETPLDGHEGPIPEGAASWMQRVHGLGEQGLERVTPNERAELYGELPATCALCHQAAAAGPR